MISRDDRRLATHARACHAFVDCNQDRHKQYLRYHLCLLWIRVLCDLHAKRLFPSRALPCNSNIYAFAYRAALGAAQTCEYHQIEASGNVVCVYGHGLLYAPSQFEDTSFDVLEVYQHSPGSIDDASPVDFACSLDDIVFCWLCHSHFEPILFSFSLHALCLPHYKPYDEYALLLDGKHDISFYALFPALNEYVGILYDAHYLHLYALHSTASFVQLSAHGFLHDILSVFFVCSLCFPDNESYCILFYMLYTQTQNHLSCFCFLGRTQELQGKNLDTWNISLEGDCRHGQTVVRYSQCISLLDVLTPEGGYSHRLGKTLFNSSNYITDQPIEPIYRLFGMSKIHALGGIRSN